MITLKSRLMLSAACLVAIPACAGSAPAFAQTTPPPKYQNVDANGVDLTSGERALSIVEGTIGAGEGAVTLLRHPGRRDNWSGLLYRRTSGGTPLMFVELGAISDTFTISGSTYTSTKSDGATLVDLGGGTWRYTAVDGARTDYVSGILGPDGFTVYPVQGPGCTLGDAGTCAIPVSTTRPNGMVFTLNWDIHQKCVGGYDLELNCIEPVAYFRFDGVTSGASYAFSLTYLTDIPGNFSAPQTNWYKKTGAVFTNLASPPSPLPTVTYATPSAGVEELTDTNGRTWRFTSNGDTYAIRRPGATADSTVYTSSGGVVTSVTSEGVTTNYARVVSGNTATMTVTNALSQQTVIVSDLAKGRPTSVTDALSRTTGFVYDGNGRLTEVTDAFGGKTVYVYDARGNVTSTTRKAHSGSLADIVTSASYPASCANILTCNQPTSTTDAKGNVTDYAYDANTGQITSVTLPAASAGGIRPQTRFGYTGFGIALPETVSTCQTMTSCAGTADEVKTAIFYNANLLPATVSSGDGTGALTATSTATYDALGNLLIVDGPLAGTADTVRTRYNAAREVVGVIGPDPDGAGPRKHRAERLTRNADGQVTVSETGTVASQSDSDWAGFVTSEAVTSAYDSNARKTKDVVSSGETSYAVSQYGYDALGRPECSALRMNSATWALLPPSACTLGTSGSFGADRITKTIRDAAGQVTKVQTALGTAEQSDETTSTYTANGRLETLTDGEGNRTTYEYDGHDRLTKTRYPLPTTDGVSSTTDYEQPSYDANGNVTQLRQRDGGIIGFTYDNLNRRTFMDLVPGGINSDVTYSYDLLGRLTGTTGDRNLVFVYDALGRMTSERMLNRTTAHEYDIAGRRTRMTWADGFYVTYDNDVTGNVTAIRENGAASGVGVLATYGYDDLGRRTSITRGNGTTTTYVYDPVSRLASLTENFAGTTHDQTLGFTYNPASQIATNTRSNDLFAWTSHFNKDLAETPNGLNQLTSQTGTPASAGAGAVTYDGRGNAVTIGATTHVYSQLNQLYSFPGGYSYYDPLGRRDYVSLPSDGSVWFEYSGQSRIAEYQTIVGPLTRRFVHGQGIDEPLVWYEGAGTSDRRWLHADERGSIVAVSNASGAVTNVNRYDEYGQPAATNIGRFGYTGQTWLPELGMWNYKARIYAPKLGRFMQSDPIGYGAGMNLYAYADGDPVNFVDPLGLAPEPDKEEDEEDEIIVTGHQFTTPGLSSTGGGGGGVGTFNNLERPGGDDPIYGLSPEELDAEKARVNRMPSSTKAEKKAKKAALAKISQAQKFIGTKNAQKRLGRFKKGGTKVRSPGVGGLGLLLACLLTDACERIEDFAFGSSD